MKLAYFTESELRTIAVQRWETNEVQLSATVVIMALYFSSNRMLQGVDIILDHC